MLESPSEKGSAFNPNRWLEGLRSAKVAISVMYKDFTGELDNVSTFRDDKSYQEYLFPEYNDVDELIQHLKGKCGVDIGLGLTHLYPKSLINRVAAQKDEKHYSSG